MHLKNVVIYYQQNFVTFIFPLLSLDEIVATIN